MVKDNNTDAMPEWSYSKYGSFAKWADDCYRAGKEIQKSIDDLRIKELTEHLKAMYDLTEQTGMKVTSDQWNEEFKSFFNPIMTKTELLISKYSRQ